MEEHVDREELDSFDEMRDSFSDAELADLSRRFITAKEEGREAA